MALTIDTDVGRYREEQMAQWRADRRIYVNPQGQVVDESAPGRKYLLAAKGAVVPDQLCRQYGLGSYDRVESIEDLQDGDAATVTDAPPDVVVAELAAEVPNAPVEVSPPHRRRSRSKD